MTISYVKQAENRNGLIKDHSKPDAEIDHVPKLTSVERAGLDTFIQGDNSSVTQEISLSENQEDKLDWLVRKTKGMQT
jgi:hypothetical protein